MNWTRSNRSFEDLCPGGLSEAEINDLFWFEEDVIAEWLGYESFEEIMERNKKIIAKEVNPRRCRICFFRFFCMMMG